jgi:hypothetical protein
MELFALQNQTEFIQKFNEITAILDFKKAVLIDHLYGGLKDRIKDSYAQNLPHLGLAS